MLALARLGTMLPRLAFVLRAVVRPSFGLKVADTDHHGPKEELPSNDNWSS